MTDRAFEADGLRRHVAMLVAALGARPEDARRVGAALVDADLCGHRSHGVRQLPYYADQVRSGEIDVTSRPEILDDSGMLVTVDGHCGFGHVIGAEMASLASERARQSRVGIVAVRNANHIGRLGEYTEMLSTRGLMGILLVTCQGADQQIAPFGGIDRRLTNNPLSISVPGPEFPITLDMALSEAAESRVLHAADLGVAVPDGWLLDRDGAPSTDPRDYLGGGSLLPVGGAAGSHKGYSLIVLTELLVGLLTGAAFCGPAQPPFSNSFVLIALEADSAASARMPEVAHLLGWIKSSRLRPWSEILVPGEPEARRRRQAGASVMLDPVTVAQLDAVAERIGVESRLADLGGDVHSEPASA